MSRKSLSTTPIINTPKSHMSNGELTPSSKLLYQCPRCDCLLSSKDKTRHTEIFCQRIRDQEKGLSSVQHGFIRNGIMSAVLVESNVRDKEVQGVAGNLKLCLLLMNEIAMDYLQLTNGCPVKVTVHDDQEDNHLIRSLICWKSSAIKNLCTVSFSSKDFTSDDEEIVVEVEKMSHTEKATSVTATAPMTNTDIVNIILDLRSKLLGRFIFPGMRFSMESEGNQSTQSFILSVNTQHNLLSSMKSMSLSNQEIFYEITRETRIVIKSNETNDSITFLDIAGLEDQISKLQDFIVTPIEKIQLSQEMKASPPKGLIVYGFTGTGKSLVVEAFVNKYQDKFTCFNINSASLLCKSFESTEKKIIELLDLAFDQAPSVIFLDRIEVIAGVKKNPTESDKRLTACLLSQMERCSRSLDKFVTLVGVTNELESIDHILRGANKFCVEIEFPIPLAQQRKGILKLLLNKVSHSIDDTAIEDIASTAFSFTGGDLSSVVSLASVHALKDSRTHMVIDDLKYAFKAVRPSAMKEISLEVPSVFFHEIGGVSAIRSRLEQMVLWPFKYPEYFSCMGISPRKGILLYGPPGCSKTMIGKALATESKLNFLSIKGPELFNKFVGESERAVRQIFKKARQAAPSILFFDEIDALAPERTTGEASNNSVNDRVLATLLTEMDGIEARSEVIIVAATNRPDRIDKALIRPGRLEEAIYVPLPDEDARREIFTIKFKTMPVDYDSVETQKLVEATKGYSGAEVTSVCTEAGLICIQQSLSIGIPLKDMKVKEEYFEKAIKTVKPRTNPDMITFYEKYCQHN